MKYKDVLSMLCGEFKAEKTILAEEILGVKKQKLITHRETEITKEQQERLREAFEQIENNRPLQYILGSWEFLGNTYKVSEGVLIPREDTICVIELALSHLKNKGNMVFADLGSGSGCIAVSIANALNIEGYAIEKSQDAIEILKQNLNLAQGKVKAIFNDMFSPEVLDELNDLDLVISNPPYITSEEMKSLDKNVLNEPFMALCGGDDGLFFYREIIKNYTPKLKRNGIMAFEVGFNQADSVIELFKAAGYKEIYEKKDLNGKRRALCAKKQ